MPSRLSVRVDICGQKAELLRASPANLLPSADSTEISVKLRVQQRCKQKHEIDLGRTFANYLMAISFTFVKLAQDQRSCQLEGVKPWFFGQSSFE